MLVYCTDIYYASTYEKSELPCTPADEKHSVANVTADEHFINVDFTTCSHCNSVLQHTQIPVLT